MCKEFLAKCKVVKNTTKKALELMDAYKHTVDKYGYRNLTDCYKDCSVFKERAYTEIYKECYSENDGYGLTIIGFNSMQFSCAYLCKIDNDWYLIYHTRDNRYAILVPDCLIGVL